MKADNIYTTSGVIAEIKDEHSREYLNKVTFFENVKVVEPSKKSLDRIKEACIVLGELVSVSKQDIGVLALSLDILEQHSDFQYAPVKKDLLEHKFENIYYDSDAPSKTQLKKEKEQREEKERKKLLVEEEELQDYELKKEKKKKKNKDGFDLEAFLSEHKPQFNREYTQINDKMEYEAEQGNMEEKNLPKAENQTQIRENNKQNNEDLAEQNSEEQDARQHNCENRSMFGEWVTAQNLQDRFFDDVQETQSLDSEIALFTLDNAMQNIAISLNIPLVTTDLERVKTITRPGLKCGACTAIFMDFNTILNYRRNKPYLDALFNDNGPDGNKLRCPECANAGLMRIKAFVSNDKITFTKGKKHFKLEGFVDYCNVAASKYNPIRNKHLLHPEIYEERQLRVIQNKSKSKPFNFTDFVQGANVTKGHEVIAYFMRRGKKGIRFGQGVR